MLKLVFFIFFLFGRDISCPLEHKPEVQDFTYSNTRSLQSTGVQPIRIHFDFSGISASSFGQSKLNYLTNILNEVANSLSSIVKVNQIKSTLIHRNFNFSRLKDFGKYLWLIQLHVI